MANDTTAATAATAGPGVLDMRVETVALDDVTPMPGNPRQGDRDAIAESLGAHGQYKPLVVQASSGHIIAGNNTWHAAADADWPEIAVQYVDVTDEQARRINLVDNRSNDRASYDERLLAEMLDTLPSLEGTGYDPADVDDLHASLEELPPPGPNDDGAPSTEATGSGDARADEHGNPSGMTFQKGIGELQDSWVASNERSVLLTFTGDTYVWVIDRLSRLGAEYGTDTNSATLLKALEALTGEQAPNRAGDGEQGVAA